MTIESVLIVDPRTLLVPNDDNFSGGGGRSSAPDSNELLLIRLDRPLDLWGEERRARGFWDEEEELD